MAGAGQVPDQATFADILLETRICAVFERAVDLLQPWKDHSKTSFSRPPRYCCTAGTKDRRFGFPHRAGLAAQQVMSRGEPAHCILTICSARGCAFERYHYERAMTRARGD